MSGRLGDTIYTHGPHGHYSYTFAPRVDPYTARQRQLRDLLTTLSQSWSSPGNAPVRRLWNLYAAALSVTNRLGAQIHLTGFNHWIASGVFRLDNDQYLPAMPPLTYTLGVYRPPTWRLSLPPYASVRCRFSTADPWRADDYGVWGCYASDPQPATVFYYKGPFTKLRSVSGNSSTPPIRAFITLPSPPASGQVIFFRTRISEGDGRLSPPLIQRVYFP